MRRLIAVLAGCTLAAGSSAADHVVLHGLSWHEGQRVESRNTPAGTVEVPRSWQSANWGLGYRRAFGVWSLQTGAYLNSYERLSVYGLADWEPLRASQWSAGLFAGLATGYSHGVAAGGFVARWQGDTVGVALRGMPKVSEKQSGAVAALELTYRIGS
jgi:hypothetical protein